ncbi:fimbrillin family protein [Phocaeicola plebeius]|uniref:fimbrillin family protein n=1 Tax=Phocaeicola plebeius TaxID=310297 RepID=UPI0021AD256E|nr:fimbrillin family protein [Phocaeicola plebeius]MCR8883522.1 fimbrillin family protein [Phocaeicola plebeius]MDM8285429.1 fimbrillin family protein [Phocaeicola plebeius]
MKTRFFAFAALALTLAACNNDNENLNDGPVAAKFTADIYESVSTRVNQDGTDWTDGDRIGITGAGFINIPYVRESGQFVPEDKTIYFNDIETQTFHAYYPYQSDGGTVSVSTAADKQGPGIDFLFASGATGDTHNPEVSFTDKTAEGGADNSFHHRMSLIKFTFKAGDGLIFDGMEPASYTLGGLKHEGTFDTATGTTAVTEAAESPITMQLGGATTSQVIILPQGVTTSLDLTVSFNGLDYTTTLPNPSKPEANQFSAGYAYTYNITLNNKGITVEEPEITPWEPGDSNNVSITL